MYKLVVVAGKLRGKEFILKEGDNVIGRDSSCDIQIAVDGISKRHFSITVTEDIPYLKDLGSSNGTFINGKITKERTIEDKDKIALPDIILQLVHVKEKKVIVKKKAAKEIDEEELLFKGGPPPKSLLGKIIHFFKYKVMSYIHGINEEYEWRVMVAILLTIFVVITVTLTITPILQDSKKLLLVETAKRGAHYAEEIARINATALEQKNLDRVDTAFLNSEPGVKSYELFDLEGRIVRPMSKLNEYIEDPFSIETRDWAMRNKNSTGEMVLRKILDDGEIGIGKKIMAYNAKLGAAEPVGVIAIRFRPRSLAVEATRSSMAYLESLVTSFIVSIIFFAIVYYLTTRPLEEMRYQIEAVLRGKKRNLEGKYLMSELNSLRSTINSSLQRLRELQSDSNEMEFTELESDESYVSQLGEFMNGAGVPVIVLNSEKSIARINMEAEDLCGIRETASQGMSLLDVSREKGFAATVLELCDTSAGNGGTSQEGEYEIGGHTYKIYATSLIGKDNFAKAYYVTFIKDE